MVKEGTAMAEQTGSEIGSLRDFFGEEAVSASLERMAEQMKSDENEELRDEVGAKLRSIKWPGAVNKIVEQAGVLFDNPVASQLADAYAKTGALEKYRDSEAYDPEEVIMVELAAHTVETRHEPKLEIVINNRPMGELALAIDLSLTFQGLILKVQDAKILEITPGACKGAGKVTFQEKVLVEKESGEIKLPVVKLGEGVPIAV